MSKWYRLGTISTDGSEKVTGVSTFWKSTVNRPLAGDIFTSDNAELFEILSIEADGELILERPHPTILSGASYAIIRNTSATTNTRIAAQVTDTLAKLGEKVTVSTTAPAAEQGKEGDIWIVAT
jgi:hypothetical protein